MLKRQNKITFRLTESEHKYLEMQVDMSKLNMEQYIITVLAGNNIAPHSPEMRGYIVNTGGNISTIARVFVIHQDEIRQTQTDIWNKVVHP